MSLGFVIKNPEGIVLAAESRVSFQTNPPEGQASLLISYDNSTKVFSFAKPHDYVGVVTWGLAVIGDRPIHSYVPEFEAELPAERIPVADFAKRLSDFYSARFNEWQTATGDVYAGQPLVLSVGGFDEGAPYARLFECAIPVKPEPSEWHAGANFGGVWGGQREVADRLLQGYDSALLPWIAEKLKLDEAGMKALQAELVPTLQLGIPWNAIALQDCIDLAVMTIRTTIEAQRLSVGLRGCGGPIDVAVVTRRGGFRFIERKQLRMRRDHDE